MTNGQNAIRGRHLDSLAADVKRFTLEQNLELNQAIQDDLAELGGTSYAVFTGATSIAGGLSGLVPAPAIGDEYHFLRGDGVWASIGNPTCTLTLSENSGTVGKGNTITFTVTTPSDGAITATSSDTSIATATVSGNTVTVTGVDYGTATITVSQGQGTDYAPPADVTYSVTVERAIGATLNETSWDMISEVSQDGLGDTYWDVGDCKEITLNGKIGDCLTLTNQKLCVFILHFNYAMNGTADNNIIWGGFKTAVTSGTDVALCDSNYGTALTDGTICFNVNHWGNFKYGGWKGADLRYDILGATSTQPSDYGKEHTNSCVGYDATATTLTSPKADTLLAALPADFRNALRLWSRWIDAKGDDSENEANIQETIDAVTLLSEFEVRGATVKGNYYERNHQSQMDYYKNGNSKLKYNHSNTTSGVRWWFASPLCSGASDISNFCQVQPDDYDVNWPAGGVRNSFGVAPAFRT